MFREASWSAPVLWRFYIASHPHSMKSCCAHKRIFRLLKDGVAWTVFTEVNPHFLRTEELRVIIRQKGFSVKVLAANVGLGVRTLQRCFNEQFRTTPKTWIIRERMNSAPLLLANGLSNKQVAAFLSYTCESNFCRDFKRHFGRAPQKFARSKRLDSR